MPRLVYRKEGLAGKAVPLVFQPIAVLGNLQEGGRGGGGGCYGCAHLCMQSALTPTTATARPRQTRTVVSGSYLILLVKPASEDVANRVAMMVVCYKMHLGTNVQWHHVAR